MALDPHALYRALLEWPKRPSGSEDEMMAREMLMMHLDGLEDIHISEEAVYVPAFTHAYSFFTCLGLILCVWGSNSMPEISLIAALVLMGCYIGYRYGFYMPFTDLIAKKISANMVASKGRGSRLLIIMSHLDTGRVAQGLPFGASISVRGWHSIQIGLSFISIAWPMMGLLGHRAEMLEQMCVTLCVIISFSILHFGYAKFSGVSSDLASVVSAAAIASNLWEKPIPDTEVRLVVLTGRGDGMLGSMRFLKQRHDELQERSKYRDVNVLSVEDIAQGSLKYITRAGFWQEAKYDNKLVAAASTLAKQQAAFAKITPASHATGYLNTQQFNRAGIKAISLCGAGGAGDCPVLYEKTLSMEKLDERLSKTIQFGESIARLSL